MTMEAFTTLQGPGAALLRPNVDTDVIIRIERLANVERDALGPYALEALRYRTDGSEDPDFVLNRPPFREAPILVTGPNFGCGSSREGAVWALLARGIRCVIGESFGDIFFANCFQNGVLALRLRADEIARTAARAAEGAPMTVDLGSQRITLPGGEQIAFEVDPMRRDALLGGLDGIGRTLKRADLITAWQQHDRQVRPWVWTPTGG
jgi:3-isopropylmalate/(R)-2-methylmalate dehydratase small subunit